MKFGPVVYISLLAWVKLNTESVNEDTILLLQADAHNYKIIGILKQLKFRLSLRHVSVHAGTIFRELSRA